MNKPDKQPYFVDLKEADKFIGKLYVFPVTEPSLLAQGITEGWFITHQEANTIVSGYINNANQWSLSHPWSLNPNDVYQDKDNLLKEIFNEKYVVELREQKPFVRQNQPASQDRLNSGSEENNTNETKIELDAIQTRETQIQVGVDSSVILASVETEQEEIFLESPTDEADEPVYTLREATTNATNSVDDLAALEQTRKRLEEILVLLLVEANLELDKDEDLTSLWMVDQDLVTGIKYLRSREDSHIILAVDGSGEVIKEMSLEDVKIASEVLSIDTEISEDDLPPVSPEKPIQPTISAMELT